MRKVEYKVSWMNEVKEVLSLINQAFTVGRINNVRFFYLIFSNGILMTQLQTRLKIDYPHVVTFCSRKLTGGFNQGTNPEANW